MKGVVFCEFLSFVESFQGADMVDDIIAEAGLTGAYTTVGTYPHAELVALCQALSQRTERAVPDLLHAFGRHLAPVFSRQFQGYFARAVTLFDFLASVDSHIHVEVRKLYADAELPEFVVVGRDARSMTFDYHSPRRMAGLAAGLIDGAAEYYGSPVRIDAAPLSDGGTRFVITLL